MTEEKKLVVVVTGASRGIGRGIARVFGRRGATVYVVGLSEVKGRQRSPGGLHRPRPRNLLVGANSVLLAGHASLAGLLVGSASIGFH